MDLDNILSTIDSSHMLVICGGIVIILYIIYAIVGSPLNLSLGPIKLGLNGKPTSNGNNKELIVERVRRVTSDIERQIVELTYETLKRQLSVAEDGTGTIKKIMSDTYYELLRAKIKSDPTHETRLNIEYKNYQMLLRIAMNECVISLMKKAFDANHLDEMTDEEWGEYIRNKADIAMQQLSDFLDLMYGDYFLITRDELSDGNDDHVKLFRTEMGDIFALAKGVQRKNNDKIRELQIKLDQEIKTIIDTIQIHI